MEFRPPGSSVHGIPQAKLLEWVAISFSRGIFLITGIEPESLESPALVGRSFTTVPLGKPYFQIKSRVEILVGHEWG